MAITLLTLRVCFGRWDSVHGAEGRRPDQDLPAERPAPPCSPRQRLPRQPVSLAPPPHTHTHTHTHTNTGQRLPREPLSLPPPTHTHTRTQTHALTRTRTLKHRLTSVPTMCVTHTHARTHTHTYTPANVDKAWLFKRIITRVHITAHILTHTHSYTHYDRLSRGTRIPTHTLHAAYTWTDNLSPVHTNARINRLPHLYLIQA